MAVTALISPATAQAAASDCKSGQVCLFENANYTGGMMTLENGCEKYLGDNWFNNGVAADNHTSSIINNSGSAVFFYNLAQWPSAQAGWHFGVSGNSRMASLVQVTGFWDGAGSDGKGYTINMNEDISAAC